MDTPRRVEDTELFWIDWDTEQWKCPRCDRWLKFAETKCAFCNVEAPDPIYQYNADRREKKAKRMFKVQMKAAFHMVGIGSGIAGVTCFLAGIPLAVVFAGMFLVYVVIVTRKT